MPPLKDALWERYSKLLDIKRRIYFMRAFVDELTKVTRGKPFQIRNDIMWNMVLDTRDKCVIDLYSLTVEMRHGMKPLDGSRVPPDFLKKVGLFKLVRDHYAGSFSRAYAPHPDDDDYEIPLYTKQHAQIFARLFPTAATDTPTPTDIEVLCDEFRKAIRPLGTDRNKNRAHAYEGDAGTAKMHSVDELEGYFKVCEDLLENLSLLSAGAAYVRSDMNHTRTGAAAVDVVDLVLFGHADDIARLLTGRTRDDLFACLHEIDDAKADMRSPTSGERIHFNQRQFEPEFYANGTGNEARYRRPVDGGS